MHHPQISAKVGEVLKVGWASYQIFKKEGLDSNSIFRAGLLEKKGMKFFQRGLQFLNKK